MSVRHRCDGTLLTNLPPFRVITPFVMRGRNEAAVYLAQELVLTRTLQFIRSYNRGLPKGALKVSIFHVLLCGIVRALALRPELNRFVVGQRVYQRNRIQVSFIVKKELTEDGEEANPKISFSPFETLGTIVDRINSGVKGARSMEGTDGDKEISFFAKFPRSILNLAVGGFKLLDYFGIAPKEMIESDPLYTSVYVANLGSVGLDAPFHHLYEWGTASIFVAIGRLKREARLNPDGTVTKDDVIRVHHTIDDRISEGIYCAKAVDLFKDFVENPEQLVSPPELPDSALKELRLVDFG